MKNLKVLYINNIHNKINDLLHQNKKGMAIHNKKDTININAQELLKIIIFNFTLNKFNFLNSFTPSKIG